MSAANAPPRANPSSTQTKVCTGKGRGLVFDQTVRKPRNSLSAGPLRYVLIGVIFLAALAVVFYFMDPMGLFSDTPVTVNTPSDTLEPLAVTEDTLPADTALTPVPPDTLQAEETTEVPGEDPYGLNALTLAGEYPEIQDPPPVILRGSAPGSTGAEVLATPLKPFRSNSPP